jgi:hypothetical protein
MERPTDSRLEAGRRLAGEPRGWRLLYTRGYSLSAPPGFARDWLTRHLPFQLPDHSEVADRTTQVLSREPSPATVVSYRRSRLDRFTEWDLSSADAVVATDSLWKRQRLELLGREEHRFMGNSNGSVVELTLRRKPVSPVSRLGFSLFPGMSGVPIPQEAKTFEAIDRAFRDGHE